MKYAIYLERTGDTYEPDYRIQVVKAIGMEALAKLIPDGITEIFVSDTEPRLHSIEKIAVLKAV